MKNKMKNRFWILVLFLSLQAFTQEKTQSPFHKEEININPLINGSLYTPEKKTKKTTLVILIAGSGPTDRNGNQKGLLNNSLRYLAEGLASNGIAVFSYDKRIFAQIKAGTMDEKSLRFEDFIEDAQTVLKYFREKNSYDKILIAGHSEGSLIGMIAAKNNADGFISIAGAARAINIILEEQIEKQAPPLKEEVHENLESLKMGKTFQLKNQMLASLFRESVQPYMISWIKYNPQEEIKKLQIPILLINGTKDLQVSASEAELLKQAKPEAQLKIITNMNHVFKEIKTDDPADNRASYTNPDLPIAPELIQIVNEFIKSL